MLNIDDSTKRAYLNPDYEKQIEIEIENATNPISQVNFYKGSLWKGMLSTSIRLEPNTRYRFVADFNDGMPTNFSNFINCDYIPAGKNLYFLFNLYFQSNDEHEYIGGDISFRIAYANEQNNSYVFSFNDHSDNFLQKNTRHNITISNVYRYNIKRIWGFELWNISDHDIQFGINYSEFQIYLDDNIDNVINTYNAPLDDYSVLGTPIPYGKIGKITNENIKSESFTLVESLCSADNLKFGLCESSFVELSYFNRSDKLRGKKLTVSQYLKDSYGNVTEKVPLGEFYCTSSQKQSSGGSSDARKITAYDKLVFLDENACDWYTRYMYGVNTQDADRYGMEFSRQVFSTYYNFAKTIGLEKNEWYPSTKILSYDYNQLKNLGTNKFMDFIEDMPIQYAKITITNPNSKKCYKVNRKNINDYSDEFIFSRMLSSYKSEVDSLGRGVLNNASICIEENRTDGSINRFVVDVDDLFVISDNCSSFNIYFPNATYSNGPFNYLNESFDLYEVDRTVNLVNGSVRLMYYNWSSKEIFAAKSDITGRDVIRSLLEITGCFYRINRYGKPEFKYCTKSGLFPNTSLYPDEDLYPRGSDAVIPNGKYYKFTAQDYDIKDYGRIQILKNTETNSSKSIVEWQYVGDETKKNTYIIDDNIFYCNELMEYEWDSMPEVKEMLENMYFCIKDIGYVAHETDAYGMPWIEPGDRITLLTDTDGFETFIFSRTMSGIQSMVDLYEAKGDEYVTAINDFGYKEGINA